MSLSNSTKKYLSKHCSRSIKNKKVLITGATSGIGFKTAEIMLYLGAKVVLACRNIKKANETKESLLKDYPCSSIEIIEVDLSDFSSIDKFVDSIPDVDVIVNNAGIFHHPGSQTKDGFELVMGTNYLGLYYLSEALLPKLEKLNHDVTYINTTSIVYKIGKINYQKFYADKRSYSRSKLCITKYSKYLANRYQNSNIHIYMNHPGIALTPIAKHFVPKLYKLEALSPFNSPEKSSLSVAYIMTHDIPIGSLVGPAHFFDIWGYPKVNKLKSKANKDLDELMDFTSKEILKAKQK